MTRITTRSVPMRAHLMLEQSGVHPLLARLYASRGISNAEQLDTSFAKLIPPSQMKGAAEAGALLADAIAAKQRILIVADYDCDGATACALGLRGLRMLGANVDYLVPNRFETGYGLSPEVVAIAARKKPDLIVTVDNGIASVEGVAAANTLGIRTLVTDHHLPGDTLPDAAVIVNPNQPGCTFPSKALAGVGVMFYVTLALRAELRKRGAFENTPEPNLASLLDLVALGTIADVVPLDANNRILVAQGLQRIRAGQIQPGLAALFNVAGRDATHAASFDLGFAIGPRLNAAGRLADMSLGIECLITDDLSRAANIAQELDAINRERRTIEAGMQADTATLLDNIDVAGRASLTLYDSGWHQGVIGILAGRVREKTHRPTFAFARANSDVADGELKASGRSIPGLHLRDALDLVSKRHPGLLLRFGGHAAAAGLTLRESDLPLFDSAFEKVAQELLTPADLTRTLETDGTLESGYYGIDTVRVLESAIWGQHFPVPLFSDTFRVMNQRVLKDKHLKLTLQKNGSRFDAIWFNHADPVPDEPQLAFRLAINEFNGMQSVQLMVEGVSES
ncbi:MAG TPA: single-stranded-DNA-specific exonuclease RecJ [Rhodocyclaceae bacterium]|nr:single-stranded-DNA-specific exonuclease RecJ [Rhodocyclaceae bacterium]